MPVIYARISDRPVADEYCAVTTQVETFYTHSVSLPADAEARPAGAYAERCAVVADAVDGDESRQVKQNKSSVRVCPRFG